MLELLDKTSRDVATALRSVETSSLLDKRLVQVYLESGLSILVHVVEHFSYHVGQTTYLVKSRKALDLGYYKGIDLSGKP